MTTYARKQDANTPEIVDALRKVGAKVWVINGDIDLLVLFRKQMFLVDVKNRGGRNRLTPAQEYFLENDWPLAIVHDVDEALAAIGAVT